MCSTICFVCQRHVPQIFNWVLLQNLKSLMNKLPPGITGSWVLFWTLQDSRLYNLKLNFHVFIFIFQWDHSLPCQFHTSPRIAITQNSLQTSVGNFYTQNQSIQLSHFSKHPGCYPANLHVMLNWMLQIILKWFLYLFLSVNQHVQWEGTL